MSISLLSLQSEQAKVLSNHGITIYIADNGTPMISNGETDIPLLESCGSFNPYSSNYPYPVIDTSGSAVVAKDSNLMDTLTIYANYILVNTQDIKKLPTMDTINQLFEKAITTDNIDKYIYETPSTNLPIINESHEKESALKTLYDVLVNHTDALVDLYGIEHFNPSTTQYELPFADETLTTLAPKTDTLYNSLQAIIQNIIYLQMNKLTAQMIKDDT